MTRGVRAGAAAGPVGVVDIGSNSIRLVVFDAPKRAPQPVFNEKILCGLGRGLQRSGELDPDGMKLALDNLQRRADLRHGEALLHHEHLVLGERAVG